LIPFWGATGERSDEPSSGRFDVYAATGANFLRAGSLSECDAAILPYDWGQVLEDETAREKAAAFVASAREADKQTAVFFWHDSAAPVELEDVLVFRTSLFRSHRRCGEFAQPAWSEDFVSNYLGGTVPIRELGARPVVGFCGFAPRRGRGIRARTKGTLRRSKWMTRFLPADREGYVRAAALDVLEAHPAVDTNILLRSTFWAGAAYDAEPEARQRARRAYVRNMVESDYVLCARGGGNFSYRLYEALSCGRIPVFIDTDCVLPLEHAIDWRDLCVWVDESDVSRIGERVASFHASLTDAEFVERQRACRRVWETHLSPQGFFAHFHEHFQAPAEP
jgi:exostosin family protein